MREFMIVLGEDFSAKRIGNLAKWLRDQPPVRKFAIVGCAGVLALGLDCIVGHTSSDPLQYLLPLALASWMFKQARLVICIAFLVGMQTIALVFTEDFPHWFQLAASIWIRAVGILYMALITFGLSELFDYVQILATTDPLTGLSNRRAFSHQADLITRAARADDKWLLVIVLDLDGFKEVNDTLGHNAGDQLLSDFTRQARLALRPGDCFARVGGDEFAGVLEVSNAPQAECLILDLHEKFSATLASLRGSVTCSMGGVIAAPTNSLSYQKLYQTADALLYSVKRNGKNRYRSVVVQS